MAVILESRQTLSPEVISEIGFASQNRHERFQYLELLLDILPEIFVVVEKLTFLHDKIFQYFSHILQDFLLTNTWSVIRFYINQSNFGCNEA